MAKELKKAFGRTIASWKEAARAKLPDGTPEDLAKWINDKAKEEGYDYLITPDKVAAKVKNGGDELEHVASMQPEIQSVTSGAVTPAMAALRELIRLLGKEELKKLIDRS
jgi:hypothetical protein